MAARYPDEDTDEDAVSDFLNENEVNDEWYSFIMDRSKIKQELNKSLTIFEENLHRYPSKNKILACLRYSSPKDIKAVLVGHDPVPDNNATGLAFSYPEDTWDDDISNFTAMYKVHEALIKAGYAPGRETHKRSICHVDWAERGLLLLNAILTVNGKHRWDNDICVKVWKDFMKIFMEELLRYRKEKKLSLHIGFFGGYAINLYISLSSDIPFEVNHFCMDEKLCRERNTHNPCDKAALEFCHFAYINCDHPTFSNVSHNRYNNNFLQKAPDIFQEINNHCGPTGEVTYKNNLFSMDCKNLSEDSDEEVSNLGETLKTLNLFLKK